MKIRIYIPIILLISFFYSIIIQAQLPRPTSNEVLDVNNNKIGLTNTGEIWNYNNRTGGHYYFPNDTSKPDSLKTSIIYSGGLWMSARETSGDLHVAAYAPAYPSSRDTSEYFAGPIDASGNVTTTSCNLWNRMFPCTRTEVNSFRSYVSSFGTPIPLTSISSNILYWPGKGNPFLTTLGMVLDHEIAPYVDANSDGIYNPIDGDFPCIKGDKAVFYVINDKGPHQYSTGIPLEVEIHVLNYAYNSTSIVNNSTFYDITVLNRSINNYTDYFLGLFIDNDLGCFNNDFVGCQPNKNMAIFYNGTTKDLSCSTIGFLDHLPIVGVKMLNSPLNTLGIQTGMTSFTYFNNGLGLFGTPHSPIEINNCLNGIHPNGTPIDSILDTTVHIKYVYPGNPADSTEWSECHNQITGRDVEADRRFFMSSGPYDLAMNQKLEFSYAVIATFLDSSQFLYPDFDSTINPAADTVQAFYDAIHLLCNDGVAGLHDPFLLSSKASVFPNPLVGDQLNIVFDKDIVLGNYDMNIININGQMIYSDKVEITKDSDRIDLSTKNLANGFYTIQLQKSNQKIQAKFIVSE